MAIWKSKHYTMPAGAEPPKSSNYAKVLDLVGSGKRVLYLGCASGCAEIMKTNGCSVTGIETSARLAEESRPFCEEMVVADLDMRSLADVLPGRLFDVVVFADILERLREPGRLLDEARALLGPMGFAVLSIPNVAHGAVRLALLHGGFHYANAGLLDTDQLRFFTLSSIRELCLRSGYRPDVIERTKHPLFAPSDLVPNVDPADFDPSVIAVIESDPEHDTLQFVVRATPLDDERRLSELLDRVVESESLLGDVESLRQELEEQRGVEAVLNRRVSALQIEVQETQALVRMREDALFALMDGPVHNLASALAQQPEIARAESETSEQRAALESALAESAEQRAALESALAESAEQRPALEAALAEGAEYRMALQSALAASGEQLAALESALAERAQLIARLELDAATAEELLDDAAAQITWLRESNLLEQAIADELHQRDQAKYESVSAELALVRSTAESAAARLSALEKDYDEVLRDFEKHTARELAEIRSEALQVNQLTKAIQRSPFWSLRMAARKLYRFGRE